MGTSRSPVAICENEKSGRDMRVRSAIAGPLHENRAVGAPRHSVAFGGKQAVRDAERRFPVRIGIAVPPEAWAVGSTRSSHGSMRIAVQMGGPQPHRVREAS
jgi:hypothetical protein